MTARETNRTRKRLEEKLAELNSRYGRRSELVTERQNDPLDDIQSKLDLDMTVQTINTEWKTQKAVLSALKALDRGEYGICQDCGEDINPKRLEAIAWTTLCIHCQESYDAETVEAASPKFGRAA